MFFSATKLSLYAIVLTWAFATGVQGSFADADISDDFEAGQLNLKNWSLVHMPTKRHWIDKNLKRSGKSALAIRVRGLMSTSVVIVRSVKSVKQTTFG